MENKMSIYELILSMRSNLSDYHNHKEQMAFRIVLYYLLGTTAIGIKGDNIWNDISSLEKWYFISEKSFVGFVLLLTGMLAFLYVIWQLGNRRYAANMVTACTNLAARWVEKPPNDKDIKPVLFDKNWRVHKSSIWPKSIVEEYEYVRSREGFFGTTKPSEWLIYILMGIWGTAAIIRIL